MIIGVSVSAGPTRDLKTSRSSVTIKRRVMPRIRSHPGEVLKQEFLVPLNMSARALADAIFVPANRLTDILRGRRDVSADTALRLGRYFGTTAQFWMNLQAAHDLSRAEAESNYIEIQPRNRGCVT
jgi:addiction module HigA family antidote